MSDSKTTDSGDPMRALLSEALDLCVRARAIDAGNRREDHLAASSNAAEWQASRRFDQHVARHNAQHPDQPLAHRSGTAALWVRDQYDRDLADWERRARRALTNG